MPFMHMYAISPMLMYKYIRTFSFHFLKIRMKYNFVTITYRILLPRDISGVFGMDLFT